MIKTIRGPLGAKLVLDRSKVVPYDPGADTPAMVYWNGHSGTLWCCHDTGEIGCGDAELPLVVRHWLEDVIDDANAFLYNTFN